MTCDECMTYEFKPEHVGLGFENPVAFVTSQWRVKPWLYVSYRLVVAILFTVWFIFDYLDEAGRFYSNDYGIYLIFATNWSFLLLAIVSSLQAGFTTYYFVKWKKLDDDQIPLKNMPCGLQFLWILYNIAANSAIVVSISYWSYLVVLDHQGFLITEMSRLKHSLNSAYIIADLMFSAMPVRIFHVIYPFFFGGIYALFNAMYFIHDGVGPDGRHYAYYVMNWKYPIMSAVTCALGFILSTLAQCFLYMLYMLRTWLYKKFSRKEEESNEDSSETDNILQDQEPAYDSMAGTIEMKTPK